MDEYKRKFAESINTNLIALKVIKEYENIRKNDPEFIKDSGVNDVLNYIMGENPKLFTHDENNYLEDKKNAKIIFNIVLKKRFKDNKSALQAIKDTGKIKWNIINPY